jgi:hypothetical protein
MKDELMNGVLIQLEAEQHAIGLQHPDLYLEPEAGLDIHGDAYMKRRLMPVISYRMH